MLSKICRIRIFTYLCNRIKRNAPCLQGSQAVIAQLVERDLAKVEVAGPSPVYRSVF